MSLVEQMEKAVGHAVRIVDIDGKLWEGLVSGFTTDLDNEEDDAPGYFSIDIDIEKGSKTVCYEIRENEIKSIEVMER